MAEDPDIQAAARKNALALKLLARGERQEALRALNDAIRIAPGYPHTYANRALVFDQMNLPLQAEAERAHARELAAASRYSEAEVFAATKTPEPGVRSRQPRTPPPAATQDKIASPEAPDPSHETPPPSAPVPQGPSLKPRSPRPAISSGTLWLIASAVATIAFIAAAVILIPGLVSDGDDQSTTPGSEQSPTTAAESPTTAEPLPAAEGSPYSTNSLQSAWQVKGLAVAASQPSSGFSGFQVSPVDITLTRGASSAQLAAFVYPNANAPQQDWDLPAGGRPSSKSGRSLPPHSSIWWNANVVIVVLSAPPDISTEAFDAFINM